MRNIYYSRAKCKRELRIVIDSRGMYAIVEISHLCTIVEKNVNDSRDFRLYLWSAVNVRITVQYCRNIPFVNCLVTVVYGTSWQVKLASHNNDTIMAIDVDELVDVFVFLIVC